MPDDSGATALATDLYQLTMSASYAVLDMDQPAVFSLYARRLPRNRSFVVAAGLADAIDRLTALRFDRDALDYLRSLADIRPDFLDVVAGRRFTGDVRAVPEGRVVFANEPLIEVRAPLIEAQLAETFLTNAIHYPTLVATKAARCVSAAPGKALVDFGMRRAPGLDASLALARASWLVGFAATSNVLAGRRFGLPVAGTLAHSFIEAFPNERAAFDAFAATFPGPVTLLVDTYDTIRGTHQAVSVARALASSGRRLGAVRLDSGDLALLARAARGILDAAGLRGVRIVVSGSLDEYTLAAHTRAGAPIDLYGVGTRLATVDDGPLLDTAYKLVEYAGSPRLKLSPGKETLVGPKQVWRRRAPDGRFAGDRLAAHDEPAPGPDWEPLLVPVMVRGEPLPQPSLDESRSRHRAEMAALPPALLTLEGQAPYSVEISPTLHARQEAAVAEIRRREELGGG